MTWYTRNRLVLQSITYYNTLSYNVMCATGSFSRASPSTSPRARRRRAPESRACYLGVGLALGARHCDAPFRQKVGGWRSACLGYDLCGANYCDPWRCEERIKQTRPHEASSVRQAAPPKLDHVAQCGMVCAPGPSRRRRVSCCTRATQGSSTRARRWRGAASSSAGSRGGNKNKHHPPWTSQQKSCCLLTPRKSSLWHLLNKCHKLDFLGFCFKQTIVFEMFMGVMCVVIALFTKWTILGVAQKSCGNSRNVIDIKWR